MQSVSRATRLLMAVAEGTTNGTGKALASAAGLAVPTAHHLLATLVDEGLLARDGQGGYILGPRIAALADAHERGLHAPEYLLGPLRRLVETTKETGYVAGWRRGGIHILAMCEGQLPVRVSIPLGPYVDGHARATGKVLLAYASPAARESYLQAHPIRRVTEHTISTREDFETCLAETRKQGYGLDEQEFQLEVSCLSVPVLDGSVVVASYSLSVPAERFAWKRDELLAALRSTAESVRMRGDTVEKPEPEE